MSKLTTKQARIRRHRHVRNHLSGTPEMPRLCVCRTAAQIYCQIIDDVSGHTLVSCSTHDKALKEQNLKANVKSAEVVGKTLAERAIAASIKKVVFDRGGFPYHGCVKALADAARKGGLEF